MFAGLDGKRVRVERRHGREFAISINITLPDFEHSIPERVTGGESRQHT